MATAPKKARTGRPTAREARALLASAPLEFRIHQDNGGDYHWQIIVSRAGFHGDRICRFPILI